MTITAADIIVLRPKPDDIHEAVRYAIKSGVPYTYNRMSKDAWRRVARIARGKVNESLIRQFAESLGIQSAVQDKSYRLHDDFDFTFDAKRGRVGADVKTFHVLTQFIQAPREPFSVATLLSGVDHTMPQWHLFFPMLIPQDYKQHKEIYVFAISVEAELDRSATSALDFPWTAFPDEAAESFLVDPKAIKVRENKGVTLAITVSWPQGMCGAANAIYERNGEARKKTLPLAMDSMLSIKGLESFLAVQLDDAAHSNLRQFREPMRLTAQEGDTPAVTTEFDFARFREVFPRQDYALYLIGWIEREDFEHIAQTLPDGAPCYFYPPRTNQQKNHAPGTKTANWYVLPGNLNPIATLTEV